MRISVLLVLWAVLGILLPTASRAASSVIVSTNTLELIEFPAVLVLPDGTRVSRSTLRRVTVAFSPGDILVYDLDSKRVVRRAGSTLGEELLRANVPLSTVSIYHVIDRTYHQPRQSELIGGSLILASDLAVTTDRPFLSRPLPLGELDSDLDGLTDLVETETGLYVSASDTGSSPIDIDSDDDGLSDGHEVQIYGTDPNEPDSDFDGLNDSDEINVHLTDPLLADTDHDGLTDRDELLVYGTLPLQTDTDGGGRNDGEEILQDGTNPLDDSDDVLPPAVPGLGPGGVTLLIAVLLGVWIRIVGRRPPLASRARS